MMTQTIWCQLILKKSNLTQIEMKTNTRNARINAALTYCVTKINNAHACSKDLGSKYGSWHREEKYQVSLCVNTPL